MQKVTLALDAERRRLRDAREKQYDPVAGTGACGPRVAVPTPLPSLPVAMVPQAMTDDPQYPLAKNDANAWQRLRCRHDFEYWCATCASIKHKTLGRDVRFVLNSPQRGLAEILEADRRAGRPMRVIMLKARQWGGRTHYHLLIYLKFLINFALWKRKL